MLLQQDTLFQLVSNTVTDQLCRLQHQQLTFEVPSGTLGVLLL